MEAELLSSDRAVLDGPACACGASALPAMDLKLFDITVATELTSKLDEWRSWYTCKPYRRCASVTKAVICVQHKRDAPCPSHIHFDQRQPMGSTLTVTSTHSTMHVIQACLLHNAHDSPTGTPAEQTRQRPWFSPCHVRPQPQPRASLQHHYASSRLVVRWAEAGCPFHPQTVWQRLHQPHPRQLALPRAQAVLLRQHLRRSIVEVETPLPLLVVGAVTGAGSTSSRMCVPITYSRERFAVCGGARRCKIPS